MIKHPYIVGQKAVLNLASTNKHHDQISLRTQTSQKRLN